MPRLDGARNAPAPLLFLSLILVVDLVFVVADLVLNVAAMAPSPDMALDMDRGHPEFFQYIKMVWILAMLPLAAWGFRCWTILTWVPAFLYLLADDSLEIHENVGGRLASALGIPAMLGLRPNEFGELILSATVGLVLLLIVATGFVRSTTVVRRLFLDIFALVAVVAVFGIVVDVLHMWTHGVWWDLVAIFEDGGEMLGMSLIAGYLFHAVTSLTPLGIVVRAVHRVRGRRLAS